MPNLLALTAETILLGVAYLLIDRHLRVAIALTLAAAALALATMPPAP